VIVPVLTVVKEAFYPLNVFQPGATIPAPLSTIALSFLNQIIDNWNAERAKVWCSVFQQFSLVPNLSPHTIGPSGATFTVPIRPVSIEGCSLNLNNLTPNVFTKIDIIDAQTYETLAVPSIATAIPTALYYEEDWPNGKLFFYPVPNYAFGARFRIRTLLGMVALSDLLDMPPGYQQAITLTLCEAMADTVGRTVPAQTAKMARDARARIEANNLTIPVLNLRDGQQQRPNGEKTYNYHDRSFL
jgi:hypothetical protein